MRRVLDKRATDPETTDQVIRSLRDAVKELQAGLVVKPLGRFKLPNATGVLIPHGLGRVPKQVIIGPPQGAATAGVIQDYGSSTPSGAPNDVTKTLSLRAINFGADITVQISVA